VLFRLGRTALALPLLRRAAAMLDEQGHGRAGLASCLLKLAAALLKSNQHAECVRVARRAGRLGVADVAPTAGVLAEACEGAQRAGRDTSNAVIDMAM